MSSTPVLLLFGAGANTGLATAKKFAKEGYKVAAVTRSPSAELKETAHLILSADLTDPSSVETVFETVTKELGTPHVVVYNSYDGQIVPLENPLSVSAARLTEIMAVTVVSAYTAARLAIKGWSTLPASASKTYLYTGNMQTTQLFPGFHALGMGKNAAAYFIEMAAAAYKENGKDYKFYFVDERTADGESVMAGIDGEAHALEFWKLAHKVEGQSHWCWTFYKGDVEKGEDGTYFRTRATVDREYRATAIPGLPEGGMSYAELFAAVKAGKINLREL
ncbi:1-deoxy-11-beta-hydroxypentalenate dehydrogenase [Cytospora mali]|uniref:1-deoxy-11-beta-hydroxypentalenate dehydrogenase n=1 Tax=Cytospora mali TaxID=578113 RepID=A0A194VXM6_CYTMA|nr:1-deoxy-11-beta-hydroxypentalenate dehydrogenase [Valsa mali]